MGLVSPELEYASINTDHSTLQVGTSDADLACHHLGNDGTDAVAEAPAGSQVVFQWVYVRGRPSFNCNQ